MCLSICVYTVLYSRCTTERDREIIQHGEIITVFDRRLWADSLCVLNDQLESLIRKIKCLNLFFFFLIQERYIILIVAPTNLYTLCNGSHRYYMDTLFSPKVKYRISTVNHSKKFTDPVPDPDPDSDSASCVFHDTNCMVILSI